MFQPIRLAVLSIFPKLCFRESTPGCLSRILNHRRSFTYRYDGKRVGCKGKHPFMTVLSGLTVLEVRATEW